MIGATAWLAALLTQAWPEVVASVREARIDILLLAWGLSLLALLLTAEQFHLLIVAPGPQSAAGTPRRVTYRLLIFGNIARHVPGRFWGVAYQIAAVRGLIAGSAVVSVNSLLALVHLGLAIVAAAAVLLPALLAPATIAALALGAVLLFVALLRWRNGLSALAARLPQQGRLSLALARTLQQMAKIPTPIILGCVAWGALSWLLYFAAWGYFGQSLSSLAFFEGVRLAALYTLAWLCGFLVVIAPSGLGVREVVFLALTQSYTPEDQILFAAAGRLWLLVNAITTAALAWIFGREAKP